MTAPLVIAVAPNGARKVRADHPAIPLTPREIAAAAAACADAGATVLHLHVRDDQGRHSLDPDRYRAAIAAVHDGAGDRLVIQATTEAVGIYSPPQQMAMVRDLRPQAVSLAIRELIADDAAEGAAADFLAWADRAGIAAQYILYDQADLDRLVALQGRGIVPQAAPNALFVLGRYTAGQQSDPAALLPFLARWPAGWPWSLCAFGAAEAACVAAACALGGHARVGFENNMTLPDGGTAPDNAALVANLAAVAARIGRPVATPAQARSTYGVAAAP